MQLHAKNQKVPKILEGSQTHKKVPLSHLRILRTWRNSFPNAAACKKTRRFPKYRTVPKNTGRFRFHVWEVSEHEGIPYQMQLHAKNWKFPKYRQFPKYTEGSAPVFENFQNMKELLIRCRFMQQNWKVPKIPEGSPKYWKVPLSYLENYRTWRNSGLNTASCKKLEGSQTTGGFPKIPECSTFIFEEFQSKKEFHIECSFMQKTGKLPKYQRVLNNTTRCRFHIWEFSERKGIPY